MLLVAKINWFGHLEIDVVNKRLREKLLKALDKKSKADSVLYIQPDYSVTDFVESNIPKRYRNSLNHGWPVRFRMNDHDFAFLAGVDN